MRGVPCYPRDFVESQDYYVGYLFGDTGGIEMLEAIKIFFKPDSRSTGFIRKQFC